MGLFDFLFGSKKKEQERQRLEEERRKKLEEEERRKNSDAWLAENKKNAAERNAKSAALKEKLKDVIKEVQEEKEKRRKEEEQRKKAEEERLAKERQEVLRREQASSIEPFTFRSNCHQRYENNVPVKSLQECLRTVTVIKNTSGCPGYLHEPGKGYIVKIYNDDLGKPNMSDKPMIVVRKTESSVELRGFPIKAQTPFGWQEVDYGDYGLIVYYKNGVVDKCVLHMYDRNTRIEYLKSKNVTTIVKDSQSSSFNNNVSISAIAQGFTFNLKFSKIMVQKQPYNGQTENINVDSTAFAQIVRKESNGITTIDISNIGELKAKNIIQENPSFTPQFEYSSDNNGNEFASAEVGNSWANVMSGKEYISLFQITKQNGKLVAFIINNLPNVEDYYYLIIFSE